MDMPLRTVRPNIVQSIRAFRVQDLQDAATQLNQHFLYANL
ncbi:MAG: barnase inhibitor, partial [Polaromonas sp.]|nr:barnase inhibitor [Polaromonas sp.]